MKNIFLSLFFVAILFGCGFEKADYVLNDNVFCSGFGTDKIECKDKDGALANGRIIDYFQNGKIYRNFTVKNGEPDGLAKVFYDDGTLKQKVNYKDGKLNGRARAWYANGKLQREHHYKNGAYDGTRKEYDENGSLRDEFNYKEGVLDGISKTYFPDGKILAETNYKQGHLDGVSKVYYNNGKLYKDIIKNAENKSLQIEREYNQYGILVREVEYNDYIEVGRKDTPKGQIEEQCKKYVDICVGNALEDLKKGCKTFAVRRMVVSKSEKGIQLENVPDVIIKTKVDYKVGDIYSPTTYVEFVGSRKYRALDNHNIVGNGIKVYEFREIDLPICE